MTFFEIEIKTLNHRQVGKRILKIPNRSSFNDLHLAIQIAFNLEMKESFVFIKDGIKYKINPQKADEYSSTDSLEGLKAEERLIYCYDAFLQHRFELNVLRCVEEEAASSIELIDSNKVYWMEFPYLRGIQKVTYCPQWIEERLAGLSQDEQRINTYHQRFQKAVESLSRIEYWQDYLHGLLVCIQFPMNHSVFIGAEAFGKQVVLDFYFHQESFMKYLMSDRNLAKKHLRKYQQQLQVHLSTQSKKICHVEVSYQGSEWESFLCRGISASFIIAMERLVKLIEKLAFFHQKDSTNPFYLIDTQENIYHEIQLLRKQEVRDEIDMTSLLCEGKRIPEAFELDCFMDVDSYGMLCVGRNFCEKRNFSHFSRHSVIKEVNDLFETLFERVGICGVLYVRDPWMRQLLQPICECLAIELRSKDSLDELDESRKLKEPDAGFVELDFFSLLKGEAVSLRLLNKKLN